MRALMLATAALLLAWPTFAANRPAPNVPSAECTTLAKVKADIKGGKFATLNVGQFHVMAGAWMVLPPITGLPDADGAIMVQIDKRAIVLWTKGGMVCRGPANMPMPITEKIIAALKAVNPAAGEKADAPEDHSEDMSL